MRDEVIPYFQQHALDVNFLNLLRVSSPSAFSFAWTEQLKQTGVYLDTGLARSSQNWTLYYGRVLHKGLKGIQEELEGLRAGLMPSDPRFQEKLFDVALCFFLNEMRTNADAAIAAVAAAVMAFPFLACFVASAVLFFARRKRAAPKDDSGSPATTM